MAQDGKCRNWVFTLNNYTEEEEASLLILPSGVKYLIVGKEMVQTPHLQGYVVFTSQVRLFTCKKLLPRAHWEQRKGSHEQARDYCKKEGNWWERGAAPASQAEKGEKGKQSIQERWELAKAGQFEQLPPEQLRIYEYIHRKSQMKEDLDEMRNYWICGESGCGKSRWVRDHCDHFYDKRINKWWDGYNHEEIVLIDDLDVSHAFIGHDLKRWADRYAFACEVKGGNLPKIRPRHIIVTSQYRINEVWKDAETQAAIRRRFHEVVWDPVDRVFKLNNGPFDVSFHPAIPPENVPMELDENALMLNDLGEFDVPEDAELEVPMDFEF